MNVVGVGARPALPLSQNVQLALAAQDPNYVTQKWAAALILLALIIALLSPALYYRVRAKYKIKTLEAETDNTGRRPEEADAQLMEWKRRSRIDISGAIMGEDGRL